MKNVLLIVLSFIALIFSVGCAVVPENGAINEVMSAKDLGNLAADLELNKVLLQHLMGNTTGALRDSLFGLLTAMEAFEEVFYRREVLSVYCDDPRDKRSPSEILTAAYRKDLVIPFAEGYNLNLLPLGEIDEGLVSVNTLSDLKRLNKFDQVIEMIKTGGLHFKPSPALKYTTSVKAHVRKIITDRMEAAILQKFTEQTGLTLSLGEIGMRYKLSTQKSVHIASYMTIGNAKTIFFQLPNIRFVPK